MIRAGTWSPIPDFPGYEARDDGQVRSLRRRSTRVLVQRDMGGYLTVKVAPRRPVSVHVLVAAAFLGPRPMGSHVRHLDGNAHNNRVANLAYGTPSENALDQVRHGTHHMARRASCKNGHEFTDLNTRKRHDGVGRECLICYRIRYEKSNEARRNRRLVVAGGAA